MRKGNVGGLMVRTCHTLVVKMQRQIEQARDALIVGLELLGGMSSSNVIPARLHGPIHVPQGETRYQRDHTSERAPVPSKTSMPLCLKPAQIASCDFSSKLLPITVAIGKVFVDLERKRSWDLSRGVVWLCSRRVVEVWSR